MTDFDLNPKRDYVNELIFIVIGAFVVWGLKGFKGNISSELDKKKSFRNVLVSLFVWMFFLLLFILIVF